MLLKHTHHLGILLTGRFHISNYSPSKTDSDGLWTPLWVAREMNKNAFHLSKYCLSSYTPVNFSLYPFWALTRLKCHLRQMPQWMHFLVSCFWGLVTSKRNNLVFTEHFLSAKHSVGLGCIFLVNSWNNWWDRSYYVHHLKWINCDRES